MKKLSLTLSLSTTMFLGALGVANFAACSSDDSSPATGSDASSSDTGVVADNYVPPKDSGGGVDSGACVYCGYFLVNGPGTATPCHAESNDLFNTWADCLCNTDGGRGCGLSDCVDTCTTGVAPDTTCQTCIGSQCGPETAACANDGTDAGTTDDAGDGGDGG